MKQNPKLRHVGILIHDWQKIRPFYEDLSFKLFYEAQEVWFEKTITVRKMKNKAGDILEFISGPWFPHMAFTVKEFPDGDAMCKLTEKLQVKYMQDPEGNWIEFVKEF
jgi:hypothetical protein